MSRSEPLPQPSSSTTSHHDNKPLPLSSSLSSLPSDDGHDYHLFPSQPCDLVLHCRKASFFVHRSVLQRHSAYFSAACEALQPSHHDPAPTNKDDTALSNKKRRKKRKTESTTTTASPFSSHLLSSSSAPSNEPSPSSACSHPSTIPCIHLPDQCGIDKASVEVFLSFLRHLYFPRHYRCPPLQPDQHVEEALDNTELTSSDSFPLSSPSSQSIDRYLLRHGAEYHSGLLSLFHYFDCQPVLQRCEQVIIADVARRVRFRYNRRRADKEWLWEDSEDEKEDDEDNKEGTEKVSEEMKEWDEEEEEDSEEEGPSGVFDEQGKVRVME
jgi:hypothetical protein